MHDALAIYLQVFYAALTLLAVYVCGWALSFLPQFSYAGTRESRYGCVDGLRGFLATGVMIHHITFAWYWINQNSGGNTKIIEPLFYNAGQVAVIIFFMITGFLFIRRIIEGFYQNSDWKKLYISRIFRIYPLYSFILLAIIFVVFLEQDFALKVGLTKLVAQCGKWMLFLGGQINAFADTWLTIFGVYWTLKYEWLFYLSIPFLNWLLLSKAKFAAIILGLLSLMLFLVPIHALGIKTEYFLFFAIGGLAAYLSLKQPAFCCKLRSRRVSLLMLAAILAALLYPRSLSWDHALLITFFFLPVAAGNSLFGLLKQKASIVLGEISYSIYLVHGLIIYSVFLLGDDTPSPDISLQSHLLYMPIIAIFVVMISAVSFLSIEKPGMLLGKKLRP